MLDTVVHREARSDAPKYLAANVSYIRDRIVNVCFVGAPGAGDRRWTLIDAGLPGGADRIKRAAAEQFGQGARPFAIVLTHGHFDHIGAIHTLAREWDAPVYAHELELPYLTGRSSYPPPDPFVGGGALSALSLLYPRRPINLGTRVQALPPDGSVPGMPGWRWIPTPGHSPGHVSFVRDADRTLIAGDAFTTTKQESLVAALIQRPEFHGPPMYFTPDWSSARQSLRHLAEYEPTAAITGHGPPARGARLRTELQQLAAHFDERARPSHGRYRDRPAITNADGVVAVPPRVVSGRTVAITGVAIGAAVGLAYLMRRNGVARPAELPRVPDDLSRPLDSDLAAADGGYDSTLAEVDTPTTIELR